ncbi:MAG TPA: ATP-binding protein [Iamia sp.]|nr:ATP-binding protein [Iamia sp.]
MGSSRGRRGRLRIYLGAAPGVGKTFAMLDEGWRRRERGTDVVVGWIDDHGRARTREQVRDLEVLPRARVTHRGATFEEMDLDALLARAPEVAIVDEYAHTNVPGSRHAKRWEDVEVLLDAGIDVISTVNVQHLESLNDTVEAITGVAQRETVPDAVVRAADQVELVDMTPEALRRRLAHGNVYAAEKVDAALGNYFREGNLGALRELALLWVADRVDESLHAYRERHGIVTVWEARERVMVALTGAPGGDRLVRRAARIAGRLKSPLVGVHVRRSDGLSSGSEVRLEHDKQLLADLGGRFVETTGDDVAEALVRTARTEDVSQIVLGASRRSRWAELTQGSVVNKVLRTSGAVDVHVITTDVDPEGDVTTDVAASATGGRRRSRALFPRRRRITAYGLSVLGPIVLTTLLRPLRADVNLSTVLLLLLSLVVAAAGLGGIGPAIVAAVVGTLLVNWYFTPPYGTITISDPENLLSLAVLATVGITVAALLERTLRRRVEAEAARAEAAGLAQELRHGEAEADRLAAANELRTALLRAVSHDLRTPLASMKASVTSLMQDDVTWGPADTRTFLETIDTEADRLDRLVGELLDMGRIEAGAVEVALTPVSIDELLAGALDGAGATPARIRIEVPDDLPGVVVDPPLVERALANVLTNALRHSPPDAPVRVVAAGLGDDVVVRVVDTGPGIHPDQRERVLQPFQRLGDGRTDPGVGLGLAVARGFTEAVGGRLDLDDTPGGGLTVTLSLPRRRPDPSEDTP